MLLTSTPQLPCGEQWAYEVKWDGVRSLCVVVPGEKVRLISRRGLDHTERYHELQGMRDLLETPCVLDGEIVALTPSGKPDFARVLRRERSTITTEGTGGDAIHYMVFDLLEHDGISLLDWPWSKRRARLQTLLPQSGLLQWSADHTDGDVLWKATKDLGLEGVVAKLRTSTYLPGQRSHEWRKARHLQVTQALVWGVVVFEGRPRSLLLAMRQDPALYIGRVGSGVPQHLLAALQAMTDTLVDRVAFSVPAPARGERYAFLVDPVVIEVRFAEWTATGTLRQPVFLRLITE